MNLRWRNFRNHNVLTPTFTAVAMFGVFVGICLFSVLGWKIRQEVAEE